MHMRTKKWARPELAACPWFVAEPEHCRGHWRELYPREAPFHLELGCGKGVATAAMAKDHPEINYLAMDISPDVLGDARRNIVKACGEEADNIRLARGNIEQLQWFLAPEDRVERIYIRFCNPWPRRRHAKRRLTHPRQLVQYRALLPENGEIWFKTDDDALFEISLLYFQTAGFDCVRMTRDLHASGFSPNYVSEHEQRFAAQGIPIKAGIWRKNGAVITEDFTRWEPDEP